MPLDDLIAEQIRYYRERAPEYDATSPEISPAAMAALERLGPVDTAIELGAGTGKVTGLLATMARHILAVDGSPEALAINRAKHPGSDITFVAADVFAWRPDTPAALVVFSALLSHVPDDRFAAFWEAVDGMLARNGVVFVIDESDHGLWGEEAADDASDVVTRTLEDGRRFRIVKVLWDPGALTGRLAGLGWTASFTRRDPFFWGVVVRSGERR